MQCLIMSLEEDNLSINIKKQKQYMFFKNRNKDKKQDKFCIRKFNVSETKLLEDYPCNTRMTNDNQLN